MVYKLFLFVPQSLKSLGLGAGKVPSLEGTFAFPIEDWEGISQGGALTLK
jgi:hypothetical protein